MPNNWPGSTRPLIPSRMVLSSRGAFDCLYRSHPLPGVRDITYVTSDHSTAKPPCCPLPSPPRYPAPSRRCFLRLHHPTTNPKSMRAISAPTTARPAITPPLSELPPLSEEPEVPPPASMTPCWTHSPKVQPRSDSPEEPNTLSRTLCWKLHDAVPFAAGESQAIVSSPSRPSMTVVRFKLAPPQKAVPGRQVHSRLEHDQVAAFDFCTVCLHPLAAQ